MWSARGGEGRIGEMVQKDMWWEESSDLQLKMDCEGWMIRIRNDRKNVIDVWTAGLMFSALFKEIRGKRAHLPNEPDGPGLSE
jgi:hypothetical protein